MLRFWPLPVLLALLFWSCGYESYTEPLPISSSSVIVYSSSSSSVIAYSYSTGEFTDNRDGRTYKYVTIGTQTWMAENLNYNVPNNTTDVCYDNFSVYCPIYGLLYDWETAKIICPNGWHLPNDDEWDILKEYASPDAGTKLKANSDLWTSGRGTGEFGFNALPGGFYRDHSFQEIGISFCAWSATAGMYSGSAHVRHFRHITTDLGLGGFYTDNSLSYVRCIKDN